MQQQIKTLMKKLLFIGFFAALIFPACTKEETKTVTPVFDARDQAVGDYTYTKTIYSWNDQTQEWVSTGMTSTGTLSFAKNTTINNAVNIFQNGTPLFSGKNVTYNSTDNAKDGFVFNMDDYEKSGLTYTGQGIALLNGSYYSGWYQSATKFLIIAYTYSPGSTTTLYDRYECKKK